MLGLTVRMGAAHHDIITNDGEVIDMARMSAPEQRKTRRLIRNIFEKHQREQYNG